MLMTFDCWEDYDDYIASQDPDQDFGDAADAAYESTRDNPKGE